MFFKDLVKPVLGTSRDSICSSMVMIQVRHVCFSPFSYTSCLFLNLAWSLESIDQNFELGELFQEFGVFSVSRIQELE